jgi:ribosome-binding protein aMBF1 (putative translation factor)
MDLKKLRAQVIKNKEEVEYQVKKDLAFQIGREVERARLRVGMTQAVLAEKVGTHQSSIARTESGSGLPSLSFLKKIADAIGVPLNPPKFAFEENTQTVALDIECGSSGYCVLNNGQPCVAA